MEALRTVKVDRYAELAEKVAMLRIQLTDARKKASAEVRGNHGTAVRYGYSCRAAGITAALHAMDQLGI